MTNKKHTPDIVEEIGNLQTELLAMIESGSIMVGAPGLSEYAHNTLSKLDRITRELHQQGFKDGEKKGREEAFAYLEEFFETETQFDHDDLIAMKSNIKVLKDK